MKVLYIMSSYNIYGGTPKKALDLMNFLGKNSAIYVYHNVFPEFKINFENSGGKVYEGYYGRNILAHLNSLLKIIDKEQINIVQTQFTWGEVLGFLLKIFRPDLKLIITFESAVKPAWIKALISNFGYKYLTDSFVYISKFVKYKKEKQFAILKVKPSNVLYNGSSKRTDTDELTIQLHAKFVLDIAGLIELKNIQVLINAFNIIVNEYKKTDIYLYIAGEGPFRKDLEKMIKEYHLQNHVFLLGYQKNVGKLLNSCHVFAHPCYAEGFGIVVAEAMLAEKPIVAANSGALPELVEHRKTGLLVDPHDETVWAAAIIEMIENNTLALEFAHNAKLKAENDFSELKFVSEYEKLYHSLL